MSTAHATAVAVIFVWLGMVLAISFIEAPLKFRAPHVTLQIGLGIGRLVFRALNTVEVVLALILVAALVIDPPTTTAMVAVGVAIVTLIAQLVGVRPALTRRSDAVLAAPNGTDPGGRSRAHYVYVGLELVKVAALIVGGITLLA
ncbi:transmembrane protein [Mycolicibacterium phlei]|jgi:hypothetical protein|uniref:Membrane protein n=1 Tax=Mycolicibacterium phlei DSM 43239 = CCUG 21000 TaxID=1226750 RepID=A0A5N5VFB0_MYCPH|nr:hypothetical protein [Mycolicibacterium phlei]VEG11766.1 transmembrane protein [Mycobacteroides chelonae]AMO63673.1 hypothetical protein MPHLCCUG_04888 [Mycolicibacterium phlei]EID12789.1 hypothetical protein MPHLEI_15751 [Mycolicibacterium phlei RIVM601174]KAB7759497.1 membrane protein [Mycolicibacterium phlei DSM 43239 = CCUG 21000]KXW60110.1 membrane protein [Mycolicibacterium phlei DSM 43072]